MSELAPTTATPEPPAQPKQDILSRVGNAAPPWANGLAVILAALVAVLSVLNVDFGELLSSKINNEAQQAQVELQSNTTIITALNEAIQAQAQQIARLSADNTDLRSQILELRFQVQALERSCLPLTPEAVVGPTLPFVAPTPTAAPVDDSTTRQFNP